MKKSLLIAILFLMFSWSAFTQNNVQIKIHHYLGDAEFMLNTGAKNNLNNDFEVTRLQYYVSQVRVVHDGGIESEFNKVWTLVNATEPTLIDLGDNDITSVEMIKLHVGVGPNHNHLDPSMYPPSHPLAPQFPSMHWGWSSGYRFTAFEGNGGSNFDQIFQLHGIGDVNYFTTEIMVAAEAVNNEVIINIDADYTRGLENLNVDGGLIVHGENGAAKQCLENFRDFVFTAAGATTATIDYSEVHEFKVFPNPANGQATIALEASQDYNYEVSVTDILGKQVLFFEEVNSNSTLPLTLNTAGLYFINLIKEGQPVITKKLILN